MKRELQPKASTLLEPPNVARMETFHMGKPLRPAFSSSCWKVMCMLADGKDGSWGVLVLGMQLGMWVGRMQTRTGSTHTVGEHVEAARATQAALTVERHGCRQSGACTYWCSPASRGQ